MILIQKAHLGNLSQYQIFLQERDVSLPGVSDLERCIKRMYQLINDKRSVLFFAWNNLNIIVGELSLSTSSRQFGTHISECGIHIHHQYRRQRLGKRIYASE